MSDPTEPMDAPGEPGAAESTDEADEPRARTAPTRAVDAGSDPTDDGSGVDWRRFGGRDLPVAIASGVFLVVLLIGTVLWHPAAFTILVAMLVAVAVVEVARTLETTGISVATPVVLTASVVLLAATYTAGRGGSGGAIGQAVGIAVLFLGAAIWELSDSGREDVLGRVAATTLVGVWVPFLASFAVLLVLHPVDGWVALLATAGSAIFVDIGAFAVGTRFGRRKLAPSVSPGKTWEGVGGGLAITALIALVVLPFLGTGELFSPFSAVIFAVLVGSAGILGDLIESMVKRDLDIKDFGGIIPGHGGVLDRVDSLLVALPTGYFALTVLAG